MTLAEQGFQVSEDVYTDHFLLHQGLGGSNRKDYNFNVLPDSDVVGWSSLIGDCLADDESTYPNNLANLHCTKLRLGQAKDIPETITEYLLAACLQEFKDQESFKATLLPPKPGKDAVTAEFDESTQFKLGKIRLRLIKCAEYVMGDLFVPPQWYTNNEPEPKIHLTAGGYLKQHTEVDKKRIQNKLDELNLSPITTTISGFILSLQTSHDREGYYEQNNKGEVKFKSLTQSLSIRK